MAPVTIPKVARVTISAFSRRTEIKMPFTRLITIATSTAARMTSGRFEPGTP
jgi:hypothetical protein